MCSCSVVVGPQTGLFGVLLLLSSLNLRRNFFFCDKSFLWGPNLF